MRQSASSSTERTTQGAPWLPPGGTPSLELVAGDELGLITRDVVTRTGALTGLLVAWNATEKHLDVICACGTAPSKEGLSLSRKRSGFAGRVLASGHTAGEPIRCPHDEPLDASIGLAQWRAGLTAGGGGGDRSVAGAADLSVAAKHNLIELAGTERGGPACVTHADPPRS